MNIFLCMFLLRAAQLFVKIELIVKCPLQHSAIMTKAFHSFISKGWGRISNISLLMHNILLPYKAVQLIACDSHAHLVSKASSLHLHLCI